MADGAANAADRTRAASQMLLGAPRDRGGVGRDAELLQGAVTGRSKIVLETCKFEDFERMHRLEAVVDAQRVVHTRRRPVVRRQMDR